MAYGVTGISKVETWTTTSEWTDDIALDIDVTTCMTNGTLAESCDEWKEGTLCCKVELDIDPATIQSLSIRFYLNDFMASGDNAVVPYTDSNSVSSTNANTQTYDTKGVWVEHVLSAALIAELGDVGGKCYLRLTSPGGAKSKIGEVNIDVVIASGPVITNIGDEDFTHDETNIVITGTDFGATETGSAKVELADSATYASATKVTQSVDTWADTSIQFDLVPTGLTQNNLWIYVTDAAGEVSDGWAVTVHLIPVITNAGDEVFTVYETNIVVTGTDFFGTQSTGKLELGDNATYASATKVTQSIDTWGDTSIQFDLTIGALDVESLWLYAVNSFGGVSAAYAVTVGLTPTVTAVGDDSLGPTETNVVLTGATFLNAIGTGKVEISDNATYATGTKVTQSIDSWANGSIQFDVVIGALTDTTLWAWVTNDLGFRNATGYSFTMTYPVAPVITGIGTGTVSQTQQGVVITGTDFEAVQGTGKVEITDSPTYGSVEQTINSWSDTSINIDMVQGGYSLGVLYMFVTNGSGERNAVGVPFSMVADPISDGFWIESSFQNVITSAGLNTTVFLIRDE